MKEIIATVGNFFKLLTFVFDPVRRNTARLRAAVDAAEKYILVNEGAEPYSNLTADKKQQYLLHFKKRFIAYN